MRAKKAIKLLSDKEFLDKLYGYAYKRCNTSYEAEDLCSDIVLMILKSIQRGGETQNFYAFAWTVAHRVYADYSEKRKLHNDTVISDSYNDAVLNIGYDSIGVYMEAENEAMQISLICDLFIFNKHTFI
jgi:DNA-directed RNA polymerase specialized sigma24 family protein